MAWSITLNDITSDTQLPADVIENEMTQHIKYPEDMAVALKAAKQAGVRSGTLSGGRTPNPSGGPEVVDITIHGFVDPVDFNAEVNRILNAGVQR